MALLANWRVEKVSADAVSEGLMQIINLILPWPSSESLRILVNLEFLKGMWVLVFSMSAEMQCPRLDKLPLILVNSWILIYFSDGDRSGDILNFSEPAKSTILREEHIVSPFSSSCSRLIWKMEWDREL